MQVHMLLVPFESETKMKSVALPQKKVQNKSVLDSNQQLCEWQSALIPTKLCGEMKHVL